MKAIDKKEFPDRLVDMMLEVYQNVFDSLPAESFKGSTPKMIRAFADAAQQFMFLGAATALEYVEECLTKNTNRHEYNRRESD